MQERNKANSKRKSLNDLNAPVSLFNLQWRQGESKQDGKNVIFSIIALFFG